MASRVHLVRHGEVHNPEHLVYASLPGYGLSPLGHAQARQSARYLRSAPVVAVWSSPLERALQTADPIARHFGLPIRVDDDLTEWRMAEDWAGIRWEDLPTRRPGQLEAYLRDPLDMPFASESLHELAERMRRTLARLAQAHDGDVVVVSHQDPVQAGRLAVTGRDLARQHDDKPGHGTVVTLRPGTPWVEQAVWHPDEQATFPPLDSSVQETDPQQLGIGLEGEVG